MGQIFKAYRGHFSLKFSLSEKETQNISHVNAQDLCSALLYLDRHHLFMGHFKLIYSTLLGGSKLEKVLSALLGTRCNFRNGEGGGGFFEQKAQITVRVGNNFTE